MFLVDPRIEPPLPWLELLPFTLTPVKSCTLLKKTNEENAGLWFHERE